MLTMKSNCTFSQPIKMCHNPSFKWPAFTTILWVGGLDKKRFLNVGGKSKSKYFQVQKHIILIFYFHSFTNLRSL